jgi:hypothetical protein
MVTLDIAFFPFIFESIVAHAPHDSLVALRGVSKAARAAADARLFHTVKLERVIARGIPTRNVLAASLAGDRLPVRHTTVKGLSSPLPAQWNNVVVLDCDVLDPVFPDPIKLPSLQVLRRIRPHFAPSVPTIVDLLRFPDPRGISPSISRIGGKRHVLVYAYDPRWVVGRDIEHYSTYCDYDESEVVFIFLPRLGRVGTEVESAPEAELEPDTVMESELLYGFGNKKDTFIKKPLWFAAKKRLHRKVTFVGLETVPAPVLAQCGFTEAELALADNQEDAAEWVASVRAGILDIIHDMSYLFHGETAPADHALEVLSLEEYRARVGDHMFDVETFADRDIRSDVEMFSDREHEIGHPILHQGSNRDTVLLRFA